MPEGVFVFRNKKGKNKISKIAECTTSQIFVII